MDDPAPGIASFLIGNALAVLVAGVLLFGVFPAIDGFPLLIYFLGVFFIPAAALLTNPAFTPWLTPLVISTFPTMSLQETYNADFVKFTNNGIATIVGIAFTLAVTLVMRSMNAQQRITRLARADRHDLADIAGGKRIVEADTILDRMLDRFEAVTIRLGNELPDAISSLDFTDLRASLNIVGLHKRMAHLGASEQTIVGKTLSIVAAYAKDDLSRANTLTELDEAILSSLAWIRPGEREAALEIAGIRLALFPDASPPVRWPAN